MKGYKGNSDVFKCKTFIPTFRVLDPSTGDGFKETDRYDGPLKSYCICARIPAARDDKQNALRERVHIT